MTTTATLDFDAFNVGDELASPNFGASSGFLSAPTGSQSGAAGNLDAERRRLTWRRLKQPSHAIKNHTATLFGAELICIGGYDGSSNEFRLHVQDTRSGEWRVVEDVNSPPPINGHTATLADGKIYVIGGWLGYGPYASSDIWVLDPLTWTWSKPITWGKPPGPCNMHTADFVLVPRATSSSSLDEESAPTTSTRSSPHRLILVFRGGDGRSYLNELSALDVETMHWSRPTVAGTPPSPRANHSSAVVKDHRLVIFGGWDGTRPLNDLHILDTSSMTWSTPAITGIPPSPRAGATLTNVRERLFLFGGSGPKTSNHSCHDDVHVFDPSKNAWIAVTAATATPTVLNSVMNASASLPVATPPPEAAGIRYHHPHHVLSTPSSAPIRAMDDDEGYASPSIAQIALDESSFSSNSHSSPQNERRAVWIQPRSTPGRPPVVDRPSAVAPPAPTQGCFRVAGPAPEKRAGHTATLVGGRRILIVGGAQHPEYLSSVYELDTDPPVDLTTRYSLAPSELITRHLAGLADRARFSDVLFVMADGTKLPAHRLVMSAVSPYFRSLLSGEFRETSEGEIHINGVSTITFSHVLDFVYTGEAKCLTAFVEAAQGASREPDEAEREARAPPMGSSPVSTFPDTLTRNTQDPSAFSPDSPRRRHRRRGAAAPAFSASQPPQGAGGSGELQSPDPFNLDAQQDADEKTSSLEELLSQCCALLFAADLFMLDALKEEASLALAQGVRPASVELLHQMGQRTSAPLLVEACEHYRRN